MAINKVIYGGQTLIDLTTDTVTKEKLLNGITAHDKSGAVITGTCTFDSDTTDATATADEILVGQTAYVNTKKIEGTMPNVGAISGVIASKDGTYTVPKGYHDGGGKVALDSTEKTKLIPANIREGVTLFGVVGTMSGLEAVTAQEKTVTPTKDGFTVTPDDDYNYLSAVNIGKIPYTESSNGAGGTTVTIA